MKNIHKFLLFLCFVVLVTSCVKEERLNYKLQNYDTFEPGAIDEWISTNLTDPYNIEVVYRYQRNMHDVNKNIAPADEAKVIPQMEVMLNGFLKLYEKVGGEAFIKQYTPKQFALFGSGDYDTDGSVKGGTADGGRRITLYGVNGLDITNPNAVQGNLGVVHHEFTHILNQTRLIPVEFEKVCVGDYYANWTNTSQNSPAISRALGFISPYARKAVGEDFAETIATLLVSGQLYYDNFAYNSGSAAYTKLKQKEIFARDYMSQFFNIDLTQLQIEFQKIMKSKYNSTSSSFLTAFRNNYFGGFDFDYRSTWSEGKTISPKQMAVLNPILDGMGGWDVKTIVLNMVNLTSARLSITFGDVSNTYTASYDLTMALQPDNTLTIVKSATQGTGGAYNNANLDWVISEVQPLLTYLASTSFSMDWETSLENATSQTYMQTAKLTDINDPAATLIGKIFLRKY